MFDDPIAEQPRSIARVLLDSEHGLRGWDPDCPRFGHPSHDFCRNRDGDPVRLGQACWGNARSQVLELAAAGSFTAPDNAGSRADGPDAESRFGDVP